MTKPLIFFSFSKKKSKNKTKKTKQRKKQTPKTGSPECRISDLHIIYFSLSIFIKLITLCKVFGLFIREGGSKQVEISFQVIHPMLPQQNLFIAYQLVKYTLSFFDFGEISHKHSILRHGVLIYRRKNLFLFPKAPYLVQISLLQMKR